jgi:hypothetical protein
MKYLFALFAILPVLANAHSMSPGFESHYATQASFTTQYTLTNSYDFPVTLSIVVFNKDGSIADDWSVDKQHYKMLPGSSKTANITFVVRHQRKLIVCSTLTGIGYDQVKPNLISRVCSRLVINSISR